MVILQVIPVIRSDLGQRSQLKLGKSFFLQRRAYEYIESERDQFFRAQSKEEPTFIRCSTVAVRVRGSGGACHGWQQIVWGGILPSRRLIRWSHISHMVVRFGLQKFENFRSNATLRQLVRRWRSCDRRPSNRDRISWLSYSRQE